MGLRKLLLTFVLWFPAWAHAEPPPDAAAVRATLDAIDEEALALSPIRQAWRGDSRHSSEWDDFSEAQDDRVHRWAERSLARLAPLAAAPLEPAEALDLRVMQTHLRRVLANDRYRDQAYLLTPQSGPHIDVPAVLIHAHPILLRNDAEAYLARLHGMRRVFAQVMARERRRAARGMLPPRFVYPSIIAAARTVIRGHPFAGPGESPLFADFRDKLARLPLEESERRQFMQRAEAALRDDVGPAYAALIAMLRQHAARATDAAGVWKLPEGAAYYSERLREHTTTQLSPEAIHAIGREAVAELRGQMLALARRLGHRGTAQSFIAATRADPRFYLPETPEGRARYLEQARRYVAAQEAVADRQFLRPPDIPLEVLAVEAYRAHGAPPAFYETPSLDGKRPGRYYLNLVRMRDRPLYDLAALTYHETLPGHHMQAARTLAQTDVPAFRKDLWYAAHGEGWALYAEGLPKELGFYRDPYEEFGRLALALFRAARLVVDTGLHARRWSRARARAYLRTHTALTAGDIAREVDRYVAHPGQATAYYVGLLKILELRRRAVQALGERFDLRRFHEQLLQHGVMPLSLLEVQIDAWIRAGGP